ncbi:thioredoxin-domain-containing protein [Pseudovirgaria hyperparasitica]|uniref:Thioredoxin-domain-containing protein n=1 Tax=Pseudovirgaria hyperparasitica TaxID=470096 RepID=A0A6A6VTT9_9PEZI|nr:thioredoxin-domain-containing protein [Pseudovirgaria hyperparasitica]KAF2753144.1 thioredoxin-domain-containing protein [Pseudovirgaria hyperparasitica]
MSSPTVINSSAQFETLLKSNTYVIVDFHATWCGPCKTIAPTFNQLAASETKPGRIIFAKVDVDAQPGIAQKYGVSAMPTFLILKRSSVIETIRGANPSALRNAVMSASSDSAKGPAQSSTSFQSKGHTLGGAGAGTSRSQTGSSGWSFGARMPGTGGAGRTLGGGGNGYIDVVVRFFGLYFTSLLSLDSYTAASESPFRAR